LLAAAVAIRWIARSLRGLFARECATPNGERSA
jgi:hypothetical protein